MDLSATETAASVLNTQNEKMANQKDTRHKSAANSKANLIFGKT